MDDLARVKKRVLGAVIDYGLVLTLTITYVFTFGETSAEGGKSVEGMKALPVFLFWFLYFPGIEGITGQTLGKRITGTSVIKVNGDDITIWASLVRHLFDMVDLSFGGFVAFIVMKNSDKKQRIGDLVAKTIVIEEKWAICKNCKTELVLARQEFKERKFICPRCKFDNTWENSGNPRLQ